jgi:hypothetical protein
MLTTRTKEVERPLGVQRLAYGLGELSTLLGISIGMTRKQIRLKEIRAVKIGRRLVVPAVEVERLLAG